MCSLSSFVHQYVRLPIFFSTFQSSMQNLLITIGQTIYRGLSLIGVLITIIVTYSLVSTLFFNTLRSGQAINYALVNFNDVFTSSTLFVRIVTGEDWHHLLWDAMVDEPYCSKELGNCGNLIVASFGFISYYFIVTFILLNVVIGEYRCICTIVLFKL